MTNFLAKHFGRDPDTNEVLWFAAPPMNVARPAKPKHSLAYLHFLATKRKAADFAAGDGESAMNVDEDESGPATSRRRKVKNVSVTEMLRDLAASELRRDHCPAT